LVFGSAFPIPQEWFTSARIYRLLGELERLGKYANKGDILPIKIPPEVIFAAERIRRWLSNSH
jgi:hypothetical protein